MRGAIGIRNRDQGGQVVDDIGVRDELARRPRVADIAGDDLNGRHDLGIHGIEPASRAERVVEHHRPHAGAARHQCFDKVGADEPLCAGDRCKHGVAS